MRRREPIVPLRRTDGGGDGQRPLSGFMFQGQAMSMPIARPQGGLLARRVRRPTWAALSPTILELATSISGVGLAFFMLMHLALLFSVLLGRQTMDDLAAFLERYYLLQAMAPLLLLLIGAHVFLAVRKAPATFRQQQVLWRHMRRLRHLDTWTWAFQVVSGAALLVLIAIHLWVILTDVPIEAAKSGARVYGIYLWFYIPFVILVEGHISIGLYRVAVKWGMLSRGWAHVALTPWTAVVLALGFAILATFYAVGGSP